VNSRWALFLQNAVSIVAPRLNFNELANGDFRMVSCLHS
jgi:hypothetical protein